MSEEFKAIETQEAFDAAIKARLERNTRSVTEEVTKKFEGWVSPDDAKKSAEQIAALQGQVTELTAKSTAAELDALRSRIAHETGLPFELAGRLTGATEEELRKDAETLAAFTKAAAPQPHRANPETPKISGVEAAFFKRNPGLK